MRFGYLVVGVMLCGPFVSGAVVGTSQAARSVSAERIALLPAKERAVWMAYLKRSQAQMLADKAALQAERPEGMPIPALPKEAANARTLPLAREAAWYGSAEARHTADVVVSYQTPAGGWSKNLDMSGAVRQRGQSYTTDNISKHLGPDDFDAPRDPQWNYVGTLDNDATNTELRLLAKVATEAAGAEGERYRSSFERGVRYLLAAQFPNGGWPQVWPLEGGYHDAITFNDDAVTETAGVLTAVAEGEGDYGFVPAELRRRAKASVERALGCILATQVVVEGKKTVWAQQHDALTLEPVAGRNFEPVALSSGESADILMYLMELPHPSAAVVQAVEAGVAWLKGAAIQGEVWTGGRGTPGGRHLEAKAGAAAIWARYYSMSTGRPVFGDRDKSIHDDVQELSLERRNGYAWYSSGPQRALDTYAEWRKAQGAAGGL